MERDFQQNLFMETSSVAEHELLQFFGLRGEPSGAQRVPTSQSDPRITKSGAFPRRDRIVDAWHTWDQ
jgi:hypothetical protein